MKKRTLMLHLVFAGALSTSIVAAFAQASTSSWPFLVDVTQPAGVPGLFEITVPLEVMDKSREDLADLRLYDARGRETPYGLLVRREVAGTTRVAGTVFNQAKIGSASEVSVDIGPSGADHNEIEVDTHGSNFRRRVDLEGSESGKEWRTLKTGEVIFGFNAQNKTVESKRISYPTSRYRFLRLRVFADELTDKDAPFISGVGVLMINREQGELTTWNVAVPYSQLLRNQGAPASAWSIDLGGPVPCDRLTLEVDDDSFSRPFQVEAVDDPQNIRLLASGELTRRVGEPRKPLLITFDNEEHARKLRIIFIDHSNQTLSISSIQAGAPARKLIFELKEAQDQPLRLFFGNPKADAPHYDFEKELPVRLATKSVPPGHSEVGSVISNPDYTPEPLPLTERIPWLIYLVLAISSVALAVILISLARTTLGTKAKQNDEAEFQEGNG